MSKTGGFMNNTKNIELLEEYFQSGCKNADGNFYFGLEVEHFIVDKESLRSIDYFEENGIEKILLELSVYYEDKIMSNGHIIGLKGADDVITLEPAAQIEISIKPQDSIEKAREIYNIFISRVNNIIKNYGYKIVNLGYHPKSKVDELQLIPKDRYKFMDFYFNSSGTCGKNMMKGSASTQISIDYFDELDFIKKFKTACILGPAIALLTDNSPIFEGEIYNKNLLRQYIWQNVDDARSRVVSIIDCDDFGFEKYAQYLYNVPLIVDIQNQKSVYTEDCAKNLYMDKDLTENDIENIISMVFPDVRLKKYIEIRVADSMPEEYIFSYTALIKGLFIKPEKIFSYVDNIGDIRFNDIEEAKEILSEKGYDGIIYGKDVSRIINDIILISEDNLDENEKNYLNPFKKLAEKRITLSKLYMDDKGIL